MPYSQDVIIHIWYNCQAEYKSYYEYDIRTPNHLSIHQSNAIRKPIKLASTIQGHRNITMPNITSTNNTSTTPNWCFLLFIKVSFRQCHLYCRMDYREQESHFRLWPGIHNSQYRTLSLGQVRY